MIKTIVLILIFNICALAQNTNAVIIKSPNPLPENDNRVKIFLGGSIDMGNAENWQSRIEKELSNSNIIILNPRRDDWNLEWKPVITDKNFKQQVEWELSALEYAYIIVMYFEPGSKSPISLLEFGMYAKTNKLMVVCPDGFWRKGNVDIVCEKYNIKSFDSFDELVDQIKNQIN